MRTSARSPLGVPFGVACRSRPGKSATAVAREKVVFESTVLPLKTVTWLGTAMRPSSSITQCAAVSTRSGATRVPPQNQSSLSMVVVIATCHGYDVALLPPETWPPTIACAGTASARAENDRHEGDDERPRDHARHASADMSCHLESWTMISPERLLSTYRRAGADPPFGDPRRHHGVPMEGYFWRLTDVRSGRVVVAFTGVSRDAVGATWATVGLAEHPGGFVRTVVAPHAEADHERLGVRVGTQLRADEDGLDVDLGPGASLRVRFTERVGWPRRALGGVGLGHVVPGLGQYWHPHMLDARVEGAAQLGERRVELTGARAYGEKNWTPYARGFPSLWWWGQAHGFAREDVSVAFAGGRMLGIPAGAVSCGWATSSSTSSGRRRRSAMRLGEGTWALRARTLRDVVTVAGDADGAPFRFPVPVPRERRAEADVSAMHLAGRAPTCAAAAGSSRPARATTG